MQNTILCLLVLFLLSACQQEELEQQSARPAVVFDKQRLIEMSASEVVPLLKSGEVSVEQYADLLLNQAEQHAKPLNAFIALQPNQVRLAAKKADQKRQSGEKLGMLFGVPIALKDLIITKDLPTSFATKRFQGRTFERNAPLVDKLLAEDAIIFAKNNAQEWAYGSNGYNSHYGQQLNPYNTDHIAGGSSGGGVASVAANSVPIAIGSDTAASIRVPAAFTGLYGLRPSTGRYDNDGVAPIAPTLDTVGPLTRSAEDLALIDSVLSGDKQALAEVDLSTLRLGVPKAYFQEHLSQEMRSKFAAFLQTLKQAGVTLVEADLPKAKELVDSGLYPILFYETYPSISKFLNEWVVGEDINQLHKELGWDVKAMWDQLVMPGAPEAIPEQVYQNALKTVRPQMQAIYQQYFEQHNVSAIIFPATASVAPLAKPDNPQTTLIDGDELSIFINDENSSPGALAGQPGVVMPMAMSDNGLPLGVSLDGPRHQDRALLAVTQALSKLLK